MHKLALRASASRYSRRGLGLVGFSLLVAWFILLRVWGAAYLPSGDREGLDLRVVWGTLSIPGKLTFAGVMTLFCLGLAMLVIAVSRRTNEDSEPGDAKIQSTRDNQTIKWITTKGRMDRRTFFLYSLPVVLLGALPKMHFVPSSWGAIVGLLYLASLLVSIFAGIRRSHDLGYSGWLVLIWIIPFAWIPFAWLYFWLKDGQPRPNQYGPPPIQSAQPEEPDTKG